jgi:sodium transport system permease protein
MRWRAVSSIFGKELVETLRDRRTLFAMIVLPLLLQPLLLLAFGGLVATEQAARKKLEPNAAIWGPLPKDAENELVEKLKMRVVDRRRAVPDNPEEEARKLIGSDRIDVAIGAAPESPGAFTGDGSARVHLYYDSVNDRSSGAHDLVEKALDDVMAAQLRVRLTRHNLPEHFWEPLAIESADLASKETRGDEFAGRVLPMVLLIMVLLGAVYPAIDMTAGEKERGTLQTLLCAPVEPVEIVAGKYLVVVLVAFASAAINLAAMGFAISRQLASLDASVVQFSLGPRVFVALLAAMIPAVLLLAALLLGLSVFARSFREAQSYITPVVTAIVLPGFVAVLPSIHLTPTMALVPVVNLALLLRELLRGDVTPSMYLVVTAASLAYATMAVIFAARVFESEQVLLGGERPWRDVFGRRSLARATPTPGGAVLFIAVLLVVVYYGSLWADPTRLGIVRGLLAVQLGLLLVPALAAAKLSGVQFGATFSLRWPTPRALAGTACLAAGAWALGTLVGAAEAALFPGSQDYFDQLTKSLAGGTGDLPAGLAVILLAGLPALCEEACFRGYVLAGLANTGSRSVAIIGSSIGFGLLHLNPFHIVPAAVLGLALGFATLESGSIWTGALVHFVNNGLAALSERVPGLKGALESPVLIGVGVVFSIIGLVLLKGSRATEPRRSVQLTPAGAGPAPSISDG